MNIHRIGFLRQGTVRLLSCLLAAGSVVFTGGCVSNKEQGWSDAKPVIPGLFSWSAERAEWYAHYHDAGRSIRVRLNSQAGGRGRLSDYDRGAHRYLGDGYGFGRSGNRSSNRSGGRRSGDDW